jgi:hypothetical protein
MPDMFSSVTSLLALVVHEIILCDISNADKTLH